MEDRLAPATFLWTGRGPNNNWTTGANWLSGVAPTATAATMDNLVFDLRGVARLSTHNDFAAGVFSSITISASNYSLSGNQLTLGDPSVSSGSNVIVNSNATGETISLNIKMGGASGNLQFFTVNAGADLTMSGKLSGTSGVQLTKDGTGILVLSNDNSGFTGPIVVSAGVLEITNAKALGDTSKDTTVQTNAQLQVSNVAGAIKENLIVNGSGIAADGALLNVSGDNTWSGNIVMDSDATFGASASSSLDITGQISDTGAGHNLTKEGKGEIIFASANTYRGDTTINNGTLDIQNANALGNGGSTEFTTTVNKSLTKTGMLQLEDPTGAGFTVGNELLILNDAGVGGLGALYNLNGNNTWSGNVTLGSPAPNGSDVSIGAADNTSLTISGVIDDLNGVYNLTKVGLGELIFTSANTYHGLTTVAAGILDIRDSQALGATSAGTSVDNGATLALEVDNLIDSVTGNSYSLQIAEPLTITGTGFGKRGALDSISGINTYTANITMAGSEAAIGVDPDSRSGHPSNSNAYFPTYDSFGIPVSGDYSLRVLGNIAGGRATTFDKLGSGQLILPNANTYTGPSSIQAGWVTIQDDNSLGPRIFGIGDTAQPMITVLDGASLHLKPLTPGANLNLNHNLNLSGLGISHPFSMINHEGALMSLGGVNTISGNIALNNQVGIGVQQVDPSLSDTTFPSELTVTGSISDNLAPINLNRVASGGSTEDDNIIDTGATSGKIVVNWDMFTIPDRMRIYDPPQPGGTKIFDSGLVSGTGSATVNYSGTSTVIEIIMDEGGGISGTAWTYTAEIFPEVKGGLTKLGQRRLNIQGDGSYSGSTDIKEGVLRAQNDTALGQATSGASTTTTVEAGAALELTAGIPKNNGGIQAGIQTWNEHLILNGAGNTFFGDTPLVNMIGTDLAGNNLVGDNMWRGPVTLNTSATTYTVTFQNALGDAPQNTMTADGGGLTGTNPTVSVATTTAGNPGNNAVQTITFGGIITGGTFTLTFNGQTTFAIAWSTNATTLQDNIQAALDQLSNIGINNSLVVPTSAVVDVRQGTRLTLFGPIDDANPAGSDLTIISTGSGGPSELALDGSNSYRGTTYVPQGVVLIVQNGAALGSTGTGETQNVTLSGATSGKFTLTFNGQTTSQLDFSSTAAQVQAALVALTTIGGADVGGSVSVTTNANVYTITFLGSLAGFHQPLLTAQGLSGTTAVVTMGTDGGGGTVVANGGSIELQGNVTVAGEPLIIQGQGVAASPTAPLRWFGQGPAPILKGQTPGNGNVSGRVTGVAVDPSDPKAIYISTAGGGAWKTKNGGLTWLPLFDQQDPNTRIPLFSGAIAVAPSDPTVIYLGTGEANNSGDSFYGTGVYKSTDSGRTWTLLVNASGTNRNPLEGTAISRIAVDPNNPNLIYVANSDLAVNSTSSNVGVWRYNGSKWFNLTNVTSAARTGAGNPNRPGPDDDFRINFPQSFATWSDLVLAQSGVLYAALGTSSGDRNNAVYRNEDPSSSKPVWFIGDGKTNSQSSSEFPSPFSDSSRRNNGNIKITALGSSRSTTTIYAAIAHDDGSLFEIQKSTNGGVSWSAVTTSPPNYMGDQGWYDSTIVMADANTVYVGGSLAGVDPSGNFIEGILATTNGGRTWTDISIDGVGNGPHVDHHAMAVDSLGRLVDGNDGGVWVYDTTARPAVWNDINGNLATITFNGIAVDPSNPTSAFGGSQDNGTEQFSGNQGWTHVEDGDGGLVHIDQKNPNNIYHVLNGMLRRSDDGGATWSTVLDVGGLYFPFLLDSVNTARLLAGGGALMESTDQGTSWTNLNSPISPSALNGVGAATFQGSFDNTGFALVTDKGANTYDPDTIYVTNGSSVFVTKDHGQSWANRTSNLAGLGDIVDLEVDPQNRDTVYVVRNQFGGSQVFMTTNAGLNWTDITSNLPDVPIYRLVIDPRNGNLYLGADDGVYLSTDGGDSWDRFGAGLPYVQAKDMVLNQALDTLSIGSYGRSMFTFWLDESEAGAGALTSISGSAVWTGPVILAGDTVISAHGTQTLKNGIAAATLEIVGTISDQTVNGNFGLEKTGFGDVILSAANVYGGATDVVEGVLDVRNPQALGGASNGTTVEVGAALELQSSINNEPLLLNGDGISFNGHFTGALRNVSNNNTYSGPITLGITLGNARGVTIGVDSGTTLTITNQIDDAGGLAARSLTKELTGTLVLTHADTYGGGTDVIQGALQIQHDQALGSTNNAVTLVYDGAQLQLSGGIVVPSSQVLHISGTGIFGSGALQSLNGNNTWQGPITLLSQPGFSPATTPPGVVSFNAVNSGDTLTIGGAIGESGGSFGLTKIGAGTMVLRQADSYSGVTTVNSGILAIQNSGSLGGTGIPEVQTVTVSGVSGTFTLSFKGQTTTSLAFNATAAQVQAALNALSTIGGVGGSVSVTKSGAVYTVTFQGSLTGFDLPQMTGAGLNGATVNVSTTTTGTGGTQVNNGATLQLDLDPTSTGNPHSVTGEPLWLNGSGVNGKGVLENVSGKNTWTGAAILLVTSSSIGVDAGNLVVSGDLAGGTSTKLTKLGPGSLTLTQDNTFSGTTTVTAGTLLADGPNPGNTLGAVTLNGGTLGGTGTVGKITAAAPGGTVNPGDPLGTLTAAGNATFNSATTYSVVLNGTSSANYNHLAVNGTLDLGGASLAGSVGFVSAINDQFVIITSPNNILGAFAQGANVFIGGMKFSITIDNSGATKTVTLTHVKAISTTTVTSSVNPSVFGQSVTFTATVAPEGGTVAPAGTVDFIIDGSTAASGVALSNGQATYQTSTLAVSATPHTVTVNFHDTDGNFNDSSGSLSPGQTVIKADTSLAVSSDHNPSVFGQTVTFTATVSAVKPGSGIPAGTVDFIIDGSTVKSGVTLDNNGQATYQTSTLAVSGPVHTVTVNFHDTDGNFNDSSGALSPGQTVNKADTSLAVSSDHNPSVFGQTVTFTATVSAVKPGSGAPAGTVDFIIDGSTVKSGVTLDNNGQATYQTSTLAVSGLVHTVTVNFTDTDGNYNNSSGSLSGGQTVNKADTSLAVSSDHNPSVFGQTVTFTATVSAVKPGSGTPAGTVDFIIDGSTVKSGVALSNGQATYQTSTLAVSGPVHTVTVNFTDTDGNYNNSSGSLSGGQTVNKADTSVAVSSDHNPSVLGQTVTFTATVSAVSPGSGTPAGTVDFIIDGSTVKSGVTLDNNDQATYQTSTLAVSATPHTVTVNFHDTDGNFNDSSGSLAGGQSVRYQSAVGVSSDHNPSVFGQTVTFTATVSAVSPGSGTPAGAVDFIIDGSTVASGITLDNNGQATYQTSTLAVSGPVHTVTVNFTDSDGLFVNSSGSLTPGQRVNKADSSVSVSSSANPSVFGQTVTFTATVSAVKPGSGIPAGTVDFIIDGITVQSGIALDNNGQATYQTSTLAVSATPHTVTVNFHDTDGNFKNSGGTLAGGQTVQKADSLVSVNSSANPSVFGQRVTFTATVSALSPGSGTPAGTVDFIIDGITVKSGVTLIGGKASYQTAGLAVTRSSPHTVTVRFHDTDGNFNGSSGTLAGGQTVNAAGRLVASLSSNVRLNIPFSLTVKALDFNGNLAGRYNGPVTLALISAPAGGTLSGPLTGRIVNGKFTFNNLKVNKVGTYKIRITSGSLTTTITFAAKVRWG